MPEPGLKSFSLRLPRIHLLAEEANRRLNFLLFIAVPALAHHVEVVQPERLAQRRGRILMSNIDTRRRRSVNGHRDVGNGVADHTLREDLASLRGLLVLPHSWQLRAFIHRHGLMLHVLNRCYRSELLLFG